ncbi:MAG: FAD-binding oxidoreductase [Candidatus Dormibacteraeota bacterium]|nr:FAD-binding oxidoreductase [Candidatus Dormibacteraeota bacterium]
MEAWDVIVVGGGVVGLSAAWRLLEAGVQDVLVVDRSYVGGGTTARGAGSVTVQRWNDTDVGLVRQSRELMRRLERETAGTFRWHPVGRLTLAAEAHRDQLFAYGRRVEATGEPIDFLLPADIERRFPEIAPDGVGAGLFTPQDGYVYPPSLQHALAGLVRKRGGTIWEGVTATGIVAGQEQANAVSLEPPAPAVRAKQAVLVCAGGGTNDVLASVGADVALAPASIRVAIALLGSISGTLPGILDTTQDIYTVSRNAGTLLVGGEFEPLARDAEPPADGAGLIEVGETVRARLDRRLPGLGPTVGGWEGVIDQTPDGDPYIGPARGVSRLWVACGLGGYGIMRGPGVGATVADLALERRPEVDVGIYPADRYSGSTSFDAALHELNPFAGPAPV